MLSSEKNIERISNLIKETKEYVELRLEYAKLDATGKLSTALSAIVLFIVLFVLGAVFTVLLSCTLGFLLERYVTHDYASAFAIVSAVYLLVAFIVYKCRRKWIVTPLFRFIGSLLLSNDDEPRNNA